MHNRLKFRETRRGAIPVFLAVLMLSSSAIPLHVPAQTAAQGSGKLSVAVTNADTQQMLEGARVEVIGLSLEAYTDELGIATFDQLPSGRLRIRASYTGLDTQSQTLEMYAGDHATLDIKLRSEVYKLATLTITGEREGNAASITSQRNAPNVKTVVSMDAFGDLANQNPGEVLIRLPGVTPIFAAEGEVFTVNIRGISPTLNMVTIDGSKVASNAPLGREFRFATMAAGLFSEMEVIKALTPDMNPDSLGGTVNMKTKTALKMRGGPEFSYRAAAKWSPSFYNYSPRRQQSRMTPQFQAGYRQLFNAFGGKRNLGITADVSYVLNRIGNATSNLDYEYTMNDPAYIFRYYTRDGLSDSERKAINARIDYKFTDNFRVWITTMFNTQQEKHAPGMEQYQTDITASRTVANLNPDTGALSATGAILPDYTNNRTEVRGIDSGSDSSTFLITHGVSGFSDKQHRFQLGSELKLGRWTFEAVFSYSRSEVDIGGKNRLGAPLQMLASVRGVGWTIDKSQSYHFPAFVQTSGPDITNLSNYQNGHVAKDYSGRDSSISSAGLNAKRVVRILIPVEFSAGGLWTRQKIAEIGGQTQWWYAGADGVRGTGDEDLSAFLDPNFRRDSRFNDGYSPAFNLAAIGQSLVNNPDAWIEDIYYRESETRQGTRDVSENIRAAYFMGKTVIARSLTLLAGVRYENTSLKGTGYEKIGTFTSITDPRERIAAEFPGLKTHAGSYSHFFPSAHLKYAITRRLLARASWSTSIGRPGPGNLVPQLTPHIANRTLTIGNPNLKPQYANNYDISLEYYFEPVGVIAVGAFRKSIRDFIYLDTGRVVDSGPDNGYGGMYEGYELRQNMNGGHANVDGLEFAYQQQLSIITDALKGLSIYANYTYLRTKGDYGTGVEQNTSEVSGFIPRAANIGLRYNYRDFSARVSMIYTGDYISGYVNDPARRRYIRARTSWNAGVTWRFSRQLRFFIDFNNLTDEPIEYYRGTKSHPSTIIFGGPNINFGINGLF